MSEMRQRRGGDEGPKFCPECGQKLEPSAKFCPECGKKLAAAAEGVVAKGGEGIVAEEEPREQMREEVIREIQEKLLETVKREPKPGLTNETKRAKHALEKSPFDLQLIYELGHAYAVDEHWSRCVNVMMRGWKRMSEVVDPGARFEFLMILCQASCRCKQYKQALAVLYDVEEPEDVKDQKGYLVMSCQVYAHNGDAQKALKAFHRAMEDEEDFDAMLGVWVSCMAALRRVGAYEAAKSTVDRRTVTDEQRNKVGTLEKLGAMREQLEEAIEAKPVWGKRARIAAMSAAACFLCVWFLHIFFNN